MLACAPARIPVTVGSTKANLLLPLYVVVAAAALALAWQLFARATRRARELGPLAWPARALRRLDRPLAPLDATTARQGAIYLLFFVLPFGLLAVVARAAAVADRAG